MTKFIAVVSGKGGVGKTTTTLNVGQALTDLGKSVIIVDANIMTPNLALCLGLIKPKATLNSFLRREKELDDVIHKHESGLQFIPAATSYSEFQKTNPQDLREIIEHLDDRADFVLIDCPAGLGYEVSAVLKHTDEALVVITPTLSSVMDGLKTMELAQAHNNTIAGVLLNMTNKGRHELKAAEVEEIIGSQMLANVRNCKKIRKSTYRQVPLNYLYPRSAPAREFIKVAKFLSLEQ